MSDYEQHIGRIKPVIREEFETDESYCKKAFKGNFKKDVWDIYDKSNKDNDDLFTLIDDCDLYKKAFYFKNIWYIVIETKELEPYDDIQELLPQSDGSFIYVMRFYNGGTCLSEMMEKALENLS